METKTFSLGLSKMDKTTYTTLFENEKGRIAFDVDYPEDVFVFVNDPKALQGLRQVEGFATLTHAYDAQAFRREFGVLFTAFPADYDFEAAAVARQAIHNHFASL